MRVVSLGLQILKYSLLFFSSAILLALLWVQLFLFRSEIRDDFWSRYSVEIHSKNSVKWTSVTTNSVKLNIIECGEKNEDLVLLLHGFPETALLSWHHQFGPICDAGYHVIAPDLRGYNQSERPAEISKYVQSQLVKDVVGLIDHFGKENAIIVGHDWGGLISWQ
eukprot:TRINITY_DN2547_c0_g1_i3.p1 TRINITY_DN2547_c0_g1~~TRINITY_DN2547_c0_g1_i3.p1  ORF type:complete len:165 (-),score=2.26 TRINITY_DN2547_c0_g1_i3:37-531(-)